MATTPFFARIAEVSLREVDHGLIEATEAIGCNRKQIIWHVLLPEALPGIVAGFTVTIVTMINSSAIAGAIGAGGLGGFAYRYGYQRFDMQIMLAVIVVSGHFGYAWYKPQVIILKLKQTKWKRKSLDNTVEAYECLP